MSEESVKTVKTVKKYFSKTTKFIILNNFSL